jgi:RNA polymerase-interacting CarD/CdnL/TRCF family regulator
MVGFKVGQKVVYPNHGIGTIEQIEQKQIGARSYPFTRFVLLLITQWS